MRELILQSETAYLDLAFRVFVILEAESGVGVISAFRSGTRIAVAVVLLVTRFVVIRRIGRLWICGLVIRWFRVSWLVGRVFAVASVLRVSSRLGISKRTSQHHADYNL